MNQYIKLNKRKSPAIDLLKLVRKMRPDLGFSHSEIEKINRDQTTGKILLTVPERRTHKKGDKKHGLTGVQYCSISKRLNKKIPASTLHESPSEESNKH
jgi:hypothetical protein